MRILVLTIFLTLLNNVRALQGQHCLDSFSYIGASLTVDNIRAQEICNDFETDNIKDCNKKVNNGYNTRPYHFVEAYGADIELFDTYGDTWNGNKLEYLNSDGGISSVTLATETYSNTLAPTTFSNLNFATFSPPNSNSSYIVVRHIGNSGQDENRYLFSNCRKCDLRLKYINTVDSGNCEACPTNQVANSAQTNCECDAASVNSGSGDCVACPTNQVANSDHSVCVCDVASNFVPDGYGGCIQCPSEHVLNNDEDGCICDTSQSVYGQPSQCVNSTCNEIYSDWDRDYTMSMSLDGVCLSLHRHIAGRTACSDTTTNHGTECIYKGPNIATGFHFWSKRSAVLMDDPPQKEFTVTSTTYTDLYVRLFHYKYKFTCVSPETNCFQYMFNTDLSINDLPGEIELDLSGGEPVNVEVTTYSGSEGPFVYNHAYYYNMIHVKVGSTLKIEKLDAVCGDTTITSPLNSDFCIACTYITGSTGLANSDGTACVCDADSGYVSKGNGCECDATKNYISDDAGECQCNAANGYALVEGSCQTCQTGEVPKLDGSACECDATSGYVSDGAGGCKCDNANAYFGASGICVLCDATNVNKVEGTQFCYLSGETYKIISVQELKDIQAGLSNVESVCPL